MANNFKTTIELSAQSPSGNLLYTTLELPATRGEITDAAHRLRNLPVSEIVITGSDALPELADTRLDAPTVDELNFFASRVNALPDDELAALGGVFLHRGNLGEFEDGLTMKDLINMTYGLDGVMIAPNVANDEQLGQFVIDNEMNDDIAALPDEIIELLDRERVGRRQRENEGGEFMNGRYVVAGGFESPEVYDGITLPAEEASDAVFRLHIAAPDAEEGATVAVELPMTQESIDLFAQEHDGQPIGSFVVVNMESGIPQITGSQFGSMDNFVLLNGIAQAYSEMNVGERMTFKAALQAQGGLSGDLSDILETAESVREYELAAFVSDEAEFFKEYLAHSLPTDFDVRWLDTLAISTDSLHLLERLGATVTDLSHGGSVYFKVKKDLGKAGELNFTVSGSLEGKADFDMKFVPLALEELSIVITPSFTIKGAYEIGHDFGDENKQLEKRKKLRELTHVTSQEINGTETITDIKYELYLGKVPLITAAGLASVTAGMYMECNLTGEASITFKVSGKLGMKWDKANKKFVGVHEIKAEPPEVSLEGTLEVGPKEELSVEFAIVGKTLSAEMFNGLVVTASWTPTSHIECTDVSVGWKVSCSAKITLEVVEKIAKKTKTNIEIGRSVKLFELTGNFKPVHWEIGRGFMQRCSYDDKCNVSFNTGTATKLESTLVDYNAIITEPDLTINGQSPEGWFTDKAFKNQWDFSNGKVTQDMTLYAKWNMITHS